MCLIKVAMFIALLYTSILKEQKKVKEKNVDYVAILGS